MRKYTIFFACCLAMLFTAATACAQQGFTGPQGGVEPYRGGLTGQYGGGFTGQSRVVTIAQAKTFAHKTPVIVKGNIVQAVGGDWYLFRDSSGEIIVKIGPKEWTHFGFTVNSSDTVEISGNMHNKPWENRPPEIKAKYIRKL